MKKLLLLTLSLFVGLGIAFAFTYEWVIDDMEYANDAAAQTAYVSSDANINSNTVLVMHMDGADDGTTFADSSTTNNKGNATVTATVTTETTDPKWGTASALVDGNSGFLTYANSADWDVVGSSADNWTIDAWVKHTDHAGIEVYVCQYIVGADTNFWTFRHSDGGGLRFGVYDSGYVLLVEGGEITDTNWHHVAMCKVGSEYGLYLDGTQTAYVDDSTIQTTNGLLTIGANAAPAPAQFLDGYIDELRIQHSNYFGAAPNAELTDTITVPTEAYSTNLQSYSESTIKTQGSYSLKGVAVITDSLNDTLTRTIADNLDLSNSEAIEYDIYALRTGSNIKIGIHDSGGTTSEHTANVATSNTNQTESWDISGVADANKDDIDSIVITISNADAANTFYLDDMKWGIDAAGGGNWTWVQ